MKAPPDLIDELARRALSDDGKWPLAGERPILAAINTWVALMEGDKDKLKAAAAWRDQRREYRVDPLADRIAEAWAHYLFGEDPAVTAHHDGDQDLLDYVVGPNFTSELERAASQCVGEGEIWPRIYVDQDVADRPVLDWVSRLNVFPYWVGATLAAAAVVTELKDPANDKAVVYRHFEAHARGLVENRLYRGGNDKLGVEVEIDQHPATADLEPSWPHGLPTMLLTRIPNRLRRKRNIGLSDFAGILDVLLDLNEAAAIGAHNMRLTARKRAIISAAVARTTAPGSDLALTPEEGIQGGTPPQARFDVGEEIFVEDPLERELGRASGESPFRILEYSFDAAALIEWKRDLVETGLSRVGLTPQYVGTTTGQGDGYAISGTALRLRLIPTDKTGRGKARYWDDALPDRLATLAQVDALPVLQGGLGRNWTDAAGLPTVERQPGLPEDETEEAQRHSTLVGAGIESRETAIRDLHPDWDDSRVEDELARIKADGPTSMGALFAPTGA